VQKISSARKGNEQHFSKRESTCLGVEVMDKTGEG
jgi:hypothetical protein